MEILVNIILLLGLIGVDLTLLCLLYSFTGYKLIKFKQPDIHKLIDSKHNQDMLAKMNNLKKEYET